MKTRAYVSNAHHLFNLILSISLMIALPVLAAPVVLATSPLVNSTASTVKPNVMLMLDDSGSMAWDYMPDAAKNFADRYGYNSNQCNGTYYNPATTYDPPVTAAGASYANSSFTNAWVDGFDTAAGTTDLSTSFTGGSGSGNSGISLTPQAAFYYRYSGTQTTAAQQNYFNTLGTFYQECNSNIGSTPGMGVFTKVIVSATSGPGSTDERANFANWYSYYSHRMLMMKTGVGQAFKTLDNKFRVGFMSMNNNNSPSIADIAPFDATQKSAWYSKLYATSTGSSTPLREALAKVGNLYAYKFAGSTTYTATITVGGSGSTSVSSIKVGGIEIMDGSTSSDSPTGDVATRIADKIDQLNNSPYTSSRSGSVVTITGPASALGSTPVISDNSGGMTFTATAFVANTTPPSLNGITPNDPMQYSCQQNFVILSTDGYWNGNAGYKLDGSAIGNQDGASPRPYYDGASISQITTQTAQTQTQITQETSTLQGTLSKVLMRCNNNAATCGTAPTTGVANANWSVVTSGSCAVATNVQCAAVSGLSGSSAVATTCKTSASITSGSGVGTATITITNSVNARINRVRFDGAEILKDKTSASGDNNTVAAAIANGINGCTSRARGNCDVSGHSATVSDNVVTITGPNVTLAPTVNVSNGSATVNIAYIPGGMTYTLNNADSNGKIYSNCTYSAWSSPSFVSSCTNVNQSGAPNNTSVVTATQCTTTPISGPSFVSSCTAGNSGAPDYINTTCSPISNTTTVAACTPQTASSGNSYTTITCTGGAGGTSDTLADTAMYYYQTDLRAAALSNCTGSAGVDVCLNNVPASGIDTNAQQHLTTYGLGLGARGKMIFSSTYLDDISGDYYSVAQGTTASPPSVCSWQTSGACNWPAPPTSGGDPTTIDDLWHASVNGRGNYFNATDPDSLAAGLANTLQSINRVVGSAAAAATSTLNPVLGNNFSYLASYTTSKWIGNLEQRTINLTTGAASQTASWCVENISASTCTSPNIIVNDTSSGSTVHYCSLPATDINADTIIDAADCTLPKVFDSASLTCRNAGTEGIAIACLGTLPAKVGPTVAPITATCYNNADCDTRAIYTPDSAGTALVSFDTAYATANPGNFSAAHISGLSQWSSLTATQQTAAAGTNLINFLRGRHNYEENRTSNAAANWLYRYRDAVLGDVLESQPAFVSAPTFDYADPGYTSFKALHASRSGSVFVGANDGMLHAFAAADGVERWAYVPSMVISNMWKLADKNYSGQHANFVNGSVTISDVCTANCTLASATWKTILVGGLNAGGRGYYALDITDPVTPALLWEFTPADNANLGYTYGKPVIAKKVDGTWVVVVTSGYDNGTLSADNITANSPAGDGLGYLYVLNAGTGAIISAISTGSGSATTPSGLAKFNIYNDTPGGDLNKGSLAGFVYGGDLEGNVWRFDINSAVSAAIGTGNVSNFATLFSDTAGTVPQPITAAPTLGLIDDQRVIYVGTGKYLESADLGNTQQQSLYAIKDDGTALANPRTTLVEQTITNSGTSRTGTDNPVDFTTGRGWYVDLPDTGERTNVDFLLTRGVLIVPTIVPSNTICSPGGYGWFNYFGYKTGFAGGDQTISPIVGINMVYINGEPIPSYVLASGQTGVPPPPPFESTTRSGFQKIRQGWRELIPE